MRKIKQFIKSKLGEKKTAVLKKIIKIMIVIKNVICWTMIALLAITLIIFLITKINGGTPSLFGYSVHRIVSGSMEPELSTGDIIINRDVNDPSEIFVDDIITFSGGNKFAYQDVTHRVIVAPYTDESGETVVVTKGDANDRDDGVISFEKIQSKYLTKADLFKGLYNFFFSTWGLIIFLLLLLLVFFDEILRIFRLIIHNAKTEQPESFREIFERIKKEEKQKKLEAKSSYRQEDFKKTPEKSEANSRIDNNSSNSEAEDNSIETE